MTRIDSYLTFNGNCREAMNFYKDCLGGELIFQTNAESPFAADMPKRMRDTILHATLIGEQIVIMGSDMVPAPGLIRGNGVTLALRCSTEEEILNCFEKLSRGASVTQEPETNFAGTMIGTLTDRFGIHWMLTL